jgi:hypothetical protein
MPTWLFRYIVLLLGSLQSAEFDRLGTSSHTALDMFFDTYGHYLRTVRTWWRRTRTVYVCPSVLRRFDTRARATALSCAGGGSGNLPFLGSCVRSADCALSLPLSCVSLHVGLGRYGVFALYFLYIFTAMNPSFSVMGLAVLLHAFVIMAHQMRYGIHKAVHPETYSRRLCNVRTACFRLEVL